MILIPVNMEILVGVIFGLLAAFVLWLKRNLGRLSPPGPWGLPIVGYLPFISSKPYETLGELAKRYGNVFSLRFGSIPVVVLNDFETTKEAFLQDDFIGRPTFLPFDLCKENVETGAFFGLPWKEHRKSSLHLLRNLGLGKSKAEDHVQEEIEDLLEYLKKNVNKPFSIRHLLAPSMSNNIASLMFGKRFKLDDPTRTMLSRAVSIGAMGAAQAGWMAFFPWLTQICKSLGIGTPDFVSKANHELQNFVRKEMDEHEKTLDPGNIRDFIDGYLLEIKKRKDPSFTKNILVDMTVAFFAAGSETVRASVEWLLLVSANDFKSQRRIQKEISDVIGKNRMPVWLDQKDMPFTEAFIMETMRWRTIVPINLLRYTLKDTELNGYFIPKHTTIMSNHWEIHHNPEYWGPDANEFKPERFIDKETGTVKKWDHYMPFSIGKRSCPGEPLAKVEVFKYFVSILQKFDVKLPEGKVADFEGELGITLQMKDQEIILSERV